MNKLIKIVSALALVSTLSLAGCKKKDEAGDTKSTTTTTTTTTPKAGEGTAAGTAAVGGTATGTSTTTTTTTTTTTESTGVPECDAYLAAFEKLAKCDKAGPALDGLKQGLEATKQGWAAWKDMPADQLEMSKKAAAPGCKAGEDALKSTASSLGCEI